MPHVINGIGTWYYGRRNLHESYGTCEHCGQEGRLSSFDTTLYAVLFMIPLVALGKKRVLAECSRCRRHRSLSLKEWGELKATAIAEAVAAFREDPTDLAKACDVVSVCAAYQDKETFLKVAPTVVTCAGDDVETLRVTAGTCVGFGESEKAEHLLRRCLAVEDDPDGRELLAGVLVEQLRPAEAAPFLQHVIDERLTDSVGALVMLAQGYQATGEHDRASAVFAQCLALVPALEKDKQFSKLQKLSKKNLGTHKPIMGGAVSPLGGGSSQGDRVSVLARLAGPVLLGLALLVYGAFSLAKGRSREIHVVSGLSSPYRVLVAGGELALRPGVPVSRRVHEGTVRVEPVSEDLSLEPFDVTVSTPFLIRPFLNRTFLINPDGVAGILWEAATYSDDPARAKPPEDALHMGELSYIFKGLHLVFEPFPEQVTISEGSSTTRYRIGLLGKGQSGTLQALGALLRAQGKERAVQVGKRVLALEPANTACLRLLGGIMASEAYLELLQAGLDAEPVRIEWHRYYQASRERHTPEHDLTAEYRRRFEREPDSGPMAYLLGRVVDSPEEAFRLFALATQGSTPTPYGHHALSFHYLGLGEFALAYQHSQAAVELDPRAELFAANRFKTMLATGRLGEAENWIDRQLRESPMDISLYIDKVAVHCKAGHRDEAQKALTELDQKAAEFVGSEGRQELQCYLRAHHAYLRGDIAEFARLMADDDEPTIRFQVALSQGETAAAAAALEAAKQPTGIQYLLLYLAAPARGADQEASAALIRAAELLQSAGAAEQEAAAYITGKKPLADFRPVAALAMDIEDKAVIMAALGAVYPEFREPCFELARKLNFGLRFPHRFLIDVLGE